MTGLKDGVRDVAFVNGCIIEEESEGRGGRLEGGSGEEIDEEAAEYVARHSFGSCLLFLTAFAFTDEHFLWLGHFDLIVEQAA